MSPIFRRESWQELLKEKVIFSVNQLKASEEEIEKRDTRSIFKSYYELTNLTTYFRRGDKSAYEGNFIPIWYYPIFFDKVIMYIPPSPNEKELRNYCGIGFKELLKLIKAGLLIPLIGNNLGDYREDIFKDFIKSLPEDKPLIRAQLFEDAFYGADGEFHKRVQKKANKFKEILKKAEGTSLDEYKKESGKNPLIPKIERLPQFIGERVCWQELFELNKNKEEMEKSLMEKSPLEAYKVARTWHYTVVPKIYSRGGFTILAENDDIAFRGDIGKAFSCLFPQRADKAALPAAELRVPIKEFEVPQALDLILWIRSQDEKAKEERQKITGSIRNVLSRMHRVSEIHGDAEFFKSLTKYKKETEVLKGALEDFVDRARESGAKRVAWRERLRYLTGGFSTLAAALREGDPATLADSLETAMSTAASFAEPISAVSTIFGMVIKAALVKEESPKIQSMIINELRRLPGKLRRLPGTVELWKEEELETPFIVLGYGLNK